MTDGAFVAFVFVLSNLVDWLVSLISPLAYLPPAFTQNSGWRHNHVSINQGEDWLMEWATICIRMSEREARVFQVFQWLPS